MCLSSVKKHRYKPKTVVWGWKWVRNNSSSGKQLKDRWRSLYKRNKKSRPIEVWLEAAKKPAVININYFCGKYQSGWHLFKKKEDALHYSKPRYGWSLVRVKAKNIVAVGEQYGLSLVRVKARNIVAVGEQHGADCLVAKEIYVIKGGDK